jgi:hypothetical protein
MLPGLALPAFLLHNHSRSKQWLRWGKTMTSGRTFELLGHDYARKDSVARVTGREIYSVDGYSSGVASSNARYAPIPVSEVV